VHTGSRASSTSEYLVAKDIHVGEEERRIEPEHGEAGSRLRLLVRLDVTVGRNRPVKPPKYRGVRHHGAAEDLEQRDCHAHDDSVQDTQHQDRCERDQREQEVRGAHAPEPAQCRHVDQLERGDNDDGSERARREVAKERRQRDKGNREEPRGDDTRHLRAASAVRHDEAARVAPVRRKPLEQPCGEIRAAERQELAVRANLFALPCGERLSGQDAAREHEQCDARRGQQEIAQASAADVRQRRSRDAARHPTHDLDRVREPDDGHEDGRQHKRDEPGRYETREPCQQQHNRHGRAPNHQSPRLDGPGVAYQPPKTDG
jgi:hypothetical protein